MATKNTLFNYFNKTPKGKTQNPPSVSTAKKEKESECPFKVGELAWCKLEGFPWWPSLICNHPTENTHNRSKNKGKNKTIHVQFFDDPPTRSWIKEKYVKPYLGSDDKNFRRGGQFHSSRPDVNKAVLEADKAKDLSLEERLELVVPMEATTEEEEDEDALVDGIDFDDDIFDNEMDSGKENEKENENANISENRSPSKKMSHKSPHKRRSKREPQKKRRKIIESGDEEMSEDEFKPASDHGESSEDDISSAEGEDNMSEPSTASEPETPVKNSRKRKKPEPSPKSTPKTKKTSDSLKSFCCPLLQLLQHQVT